MDSLYLYQSLLLFPSLLLLLFPRLFLLLLLSLSEFNGLELGLELEDPELYIIYSYYNNPLSLPSNSLLSISKSLDKILDILFSLILLL